MLPAPAAAGSLARPAAGSAGIRRAPAETPMGRGQLRGRRGQGPRRGGAGSHGPGGRVGREQRDGSAEDGWDQVRGGLRSHVADRHTDFPRGASRKAAPAAEPSGAPAAGSARPGTAQGQSGFFSLAFPARCFEAFLPLGTARRLELKVWISERQELISYVQECPESKFLTVLK